MVTGHLLIQEAHRCPRATIALSFQPSGCNTLPGDGLRVREGITLPPLTPLFVGQKNRYSSPFYIYRTRIKCARVVMYRTALAAFFPVWPYALRLIYSFKKILELSSFPRHSVTCGNYRTPLSFFIIFIIGVRQLILHKLLTIRQYCDLIQIYCQMFLFLFWHNHLWRH